jgi:pimeloyl-ACP methyl ester carboxylesterase
MEERTDGILNYVVTGEGPPVILVHGLAASRRDWEKLIPRLEQAGFQLYVPDLLGHGSSVKPYDSRLYSSRSVYGTLENWIDHLDLKQPPALVGHSLGGYLSLHYTLSHPERVRGLVLIDPYYSQAQLNPGARMVFRKPGWTGRLVSRLPKWLIGVAGYMDPSNAARLPKDTRLQIAEDYKRASPNIFHIPATIVDLTPSLKDIHVPAMVVYGDSDMTLAPRSFDELTTLMPNATPKKVEGVGHQPHIARPEEVNQMVLEFLLDLEPGGKNDG